MTSLFAILFGSSALLGLWFVAALGSPTHSAEPSMAWLQAGLALVAVMVDVMLLLALYHVRAPGWAYALVLLAQDVVFAWRLVVLYRARRGAG